MIFSLGERKVETHGNYYVADNATVIGSVVLAQDANVWFNAVVRGDNDVITIGRRSNVQDAAVLHTDPGIKLSVGDNVSIGHMAVLHGCAVGDGSLIGIKSVILNHAVIGKNCLIGANALVTEGKVIPDGSLVVGSPGKVIRSLTDEEIAVLKSNADGYVEKARRYRDQLKACGVSPLPTGRARSG